MTDETDPAGWEGVRIFDVSNPREPKFVTGVYTDCGAHTIAAHPKSGRELLLYVSSYSLSPGPTCGPERGPAVGRDPLHGVRCCACRSTIQGLRARSSSPRSPIPGIPTISSSQPSMGLPGPAANGTRACHDITVFVELRLAAGACIEQAQLWRIRSDGISDTRQPVVGLR